MFSRATEHRPAFCECYVCTSKHTAKCRPSSTEMMMMTMMMLMMMISVQSTHDGRQHMVTAVRPPSEMIQRWRAAWAANTGLSDLNDTPFGFVQVALQPFGSANRARVHA